MSSVFTHYKSTTVYKLCTLSIINIIGIVLHHGSYQRAIEAQVEEQRQQKAREEAIQQAMEQEEERRIAKERERLHQEYLRETLLQRQKAVRKPVGQ